MDFKKIQISAQNPKVLILGSTEKCHFVAKTDRNSVFLGHETYISDQLDILVPYINSYRFSNLSNFVSKFEVLAFDFTEKRQFMRKTDRNSVFLDRKAHILYQLYIMVLYINFYRFLIIFKFCVKIQRC
jgi:hypothetical protein